MISVIVESLLLLALLLGIVHYIEIQYPFYFPAPGGSYPVGISATYWVDMDRKEPHVVDQAYPQRELVGQLWYPAEKIRRRSFALYDASSWKEALRRCHVPDFLLTGFDSMFTHAYAEIAPSKEQKHFPVVIIEHGIGGIGLGVYVTLAEALASHGYIVVAINHTHAATLVTFPDGRMVSNEHMPHLDKLERSDRLKLLALEQRIWIDDIHFVLQELEIFNNRDERFKGKLDLTRIGIVGHSFGGSVAAELARTDTRIKAGINMDGALRGEHAQDVFDVPFMFLMANNKHGGPLEDNYALFKQLAKDAYFIMIDKTGHDSFCDTGLLAKRSVIFGLLDKWQNGLDLLDADYVRDIVQSLVIGFFDKYLKKESSTTLDALSTTYKEVRIQAK